MLVGTVPDCVGPGRRREQGTCAMTKITIGAAITGGIPRLLLAAAALSPAGPEPPGLVRRWASSFMWYSPIALLAGFSKAAPRRSTQR